MQAISNKLNDVGEWVYRLVILNFLWMGFSILGLGILGIFPATSALFSVLRKGLMNKKKVKIAHDFSHFYRADFWKSNALGYLMVFIAAMLWIDFRFFMSFTSFWMFVIAHFMLFLCAFSILALCLLFPIYAHYKLSMLQYIKHALLYPITHIWTMVFMIASLLIYYIIVYHVPGFLPFIGISFPCFLIMKVIFPSFQPQKQKAKGWFKSKKEESLYY